MADNLLVKDATGANVTMRTKDVGAGVECSMSIPTDATGAVAWGTAGTANANVMTVQGIASGVAQPISGTVAATQSGTWSARVQDGAGNAITSTASALDVNIKSGGGTGGTAIADESAFTEASTLFTPIGGYFQTSPTALTTTQAGAVSMTANRSMFVSAEIRGTWNIGTVTAVTGITNALPAGTNVIGHVIVDSGAITANAGTNLNTSALALESGGNLATIAGAIISQGTALGTIKELMTAGSVTTNAPTYTTGNINPFSLTTAGGLRVDLKDSASNTNNFNINLAASAATVTVSGTVTANQGGAPWTVNPGTAANWGVGATGAAVPANADYIAGLAQTALPSAATAGNLTGAMIDKFGRQVALVSTIRDLVGTQTTTISASTTETTIVTAAASVFNDLIMLIVTNTSASTSTRIDFRDTTGGSVLFSLISIGGQQPVGFALPTPVPQTSVNTNWTAQCATSTTDVRIYAVFAKNK